MNPLRIVTNAVNRLVFQAHRAEFYRDFAEMYRRSEPVLSWLDGEIANSQRTRQAWRVWGLRGISARYRSGQNVGRTAYTLAGVMPSSDRMMLAAVDRADDRPKALDALATAIDQQNKIKLVLAEAMVMPVTLIPLCYGLTAILSDVILAIDKAAPAYVKPELWTGANWLAREIAEITVGYGPLLMGGLVAAIAAALVSLPRWVGVQRLTADKLPVYSLYRDFQAGLLLTSLATFLQTGAPLRAALEDIAGESNRWMRWQLRRVMVSLDDNPTGTVQAFSRGLLSPALLSRMSTLSRSSASFADVLVELGTKEAKTVHAKIKAASMVASAAVVGVLATVATFMGLAAIFVPGSFANLVDPSNAMTLQQQHQSQQAAPAATPR